MPEPQFHIEATTQSVSVRMDTGRKRFCALAFFVGFMILAICALLFLPGKLGNPSMWRDLSTSSIDSAGFWAPIILLLAFLVFMLLTTKRYVMLSYPSDEKLYCDRSRLSVSRVRWPDIGNDPWETFLLVGSCTVFGYRRRAQHPRRTGQTRWYSLLPCGPGPALVEGF